MATPTLHYSFAGRRVLVTGGASGIGRGITAAFHADGAQVFVLDRNLELLADLKSELPNVNTFCLDLLDWAETRRLVESLAPLDHLVNNAGILDVSPLLETTAETFDKVIGVNVKAMLNVSQAFVKGLKAGAGGTIVNVSSISDTMAASGMGIYCTSKAAVTMLTKSMALEFGPMEVNVNCVCPGSVATRIMDDAKVEPEFTALMAARDKSRIILKHRPMVPRDIVNGVLFLSSPLAEMVTGASLVIDQGMRVT